MCECVVNFQAKRVNVEDDEGMCGVLDGIALLCGETGYEESSGGVVDVQSCSGFGVSGTDADVLCEDGFSQARVEQNREEKRREEKSLQPTG